jgi:hypothetical protein
MKKIFCSIVLACAVLPGISATNVFAQSATVPIVLNEIVINPPGADARDGCEYVEFRSLSNAAGVVGNFTYADIEGDFSDNPGQVNYSRDLTGTPVAANGLIVIAADTRCRTFPGNATVIFDPYFNYFPANVNNGTNSFVILEGSFDFPNPNSAPPIDLDANNDGRLDDGLIVFDGIAARDSDDFRDLVYAVELLRPAGTPPRETINAAVRCAGDTDRNDASAFFYGNLLGPAPNVIEFDAALNTRSSNFPIAGRLNPGTPTPMINLSVLGTYAAGVYDQGAAEIVSYDPITKRLFVVNGATSRIDVLNAANPGSLSLLFSINLAPYGRQANSVDIRNGIVAVAVEAVVKTDPGKAVFFDANGNFLKEVTVGALPDMLTFTPDGNKVLVANEGEPNDAYTVDPPGSVSIVNISGGVQNATVTTAGFAAFNNAPLDPSIRIFGPGASVAQDLEPEYIAVSPDSTVAWVTLQENNALGIFNLTTGQFTALRGLGFKNHNLPRNGFDPSDQNGGVINIGNYPVFGMYQPDAIASFTSGGQTFLITANEGDVREYAGFNEAVRLGSSSYVLDPTIFPDAVALKNNNELGRLNVTRATGDADGDGDFDRILAFGARSFSIRNAAGNLIYDSGDDIEQITAAANPQFFNASNSNNTKKNRSDDKGPEPEGVTVGQAYGRSYGFIGLERIGGVLVYDLTDPTNPQFVQYINNRNFTAATNTPAAGDLGPEGLLFISASNSPNGKPLLVVANEVSGTTTVYEIAQTGCN